MSTDGTQRPETNKKPRKDKSPGRHSLLVRCGATLLVFLVAAVSLGVRLFQLQITQQSDWAARASGQYLDSTPIQPNRGSIYDAGLNTLAMSVTMWTIEAAPDVMDGSKLTDQAYSEDPALIAARELARILELDETELYEKLSDEESRYYKIASKVELPVKEEIQEMCATYGLRGIYYAEDSQRYYPYEELAATVMGFVNEDGSGIEGLEYKYNKELTGEEGRSISPVNAWGGQVAVGEDAIEYPAEDGGSLVLTLDIEIQQSLETNLASVMQQYNVQNGAMGIVMDVNTGAILAMASMNSYDPNDPYRIYDDAKALELETITDPEEYNAAQAEYRYEQWRNKAVSDTYEPGSVLKVVTAAAALDSGAYSPSSTFYCTSTIEVADREFGCAQGKAHGVLTVGGALIESCNCSFIQMSAGMTTSTWYDYLNAFGLTEPTGVDLSGEPSLNQILNGNLIYTENAMGPVELASCSFGQSNKYTALQMMTAACAAVNGGNLMQPHIVSQLLDNEGNVVESYGPVAKRQVISAETSALLCAYMEEMVATSANGRNAYIAGYHVGGKSGTSEKIEKMQQEGSENLYISSFFGFAPANDPQVAVLIVLDEPQDPGYGTYFGGRLAGPTAREVLNDALQVMGVEPDYNTDDDLSRTTLSTPNFVGGSTADAMATLSQKNLTYIVVGEGDTVTAQYPSAYSQIPYGGQVVLHTDASIPVETVEMPDVSGLSATAAKTLLRNLGLNPITTGAPDDGTNVQVSSQSIAVGEAVPKGTVVTLTMIDTTVVSVM